ncbi:general secretion pathway protein GspK [Vibrio rotiferianus]|uniref:general secretion pathway protein GspK n=1 Tax=Vibrio rotiferianus TaxID=190895 RepID=UPI002493C0B6|nr:type II secretion system protein GspK [Vibrio rotiferianus]
MRAFRQQGVALIQVLLISTILSIFALQINQTSRNQVLLAKGFIDKSDAINKIRTARSQLFYALSVEARTQDGGSDNKLAKTWNFYNKPFKAPNGVVIKIQDIGGLLKLTNATSTQLYQVLQNIGLTKEEADVYVASLQDWQDGDDLTRFNGMETDEYLEQGMRPPRNSRIQFLEELEAVNGMKPQAWARLKPLITTQPVAQFNPYTAPEEVLSALYSDSIAQRVKSLRQQESYVTSQDFQQETGIYPGEWETVYPSIYSRISLEYGKGEDKIVELVSIKTLRNGLDIFQVTSRSEY